MFNLNYIKEKYDLEGRFASLLTEMQCLIVKCKAEQFVDVNAELLQKTVIDYFVDIDRLKHYENISRISVSKIYAYETYWILQRKPIQITRPDGIDESNLYINEKVCTAMIIPKMFAEAGRRPNDKNRKLQKFMNLIFYTFKYRDYTKKVIGAAYRSVFAWARTIRRAMIIVVFYCKRIMNKKGVSRPAGSF